MRIVRSEKCLFDLLIDRLEDGPTQPVTAWFTMIKQPVIDEFSEFGIAANLQADRWRVLLECLFEAGIAEKTVQATNGMLNLVTLTMAEMAQLGQNGVIYRASAIVLMVVELGVAEHLTRTEEGEFTVLRAGRGWFKRFAFDVEVPLRNEHLTNWGRKPALITKIPMAQAREPVLTIDG